MEGLALRAEPLPMRGFFESHTPQVIPLDWAVGTVVTSNHAVLVRLSADAIHLLDGDLGSGLGDLVQNLLAFGRFEFLLGFGRKDLRGVVDLLVNHLFLLVFLLLFDVLVEFLYLLFDQLVRVLDGLFELLCSEDFFDLKSNALLVYQSLLLQVLFLLELAEHFFELDFQKANET